MMRTKDNEEWRITYSNIQDTLRNREQISLTSGYNKKTAEKFVFLNVGYIEEGTEEALRSGYIEEQRIVDTYI